MIIKSKMFSVSNTIESHPSFRKRLGRVILTSGQLSSTCDPVIQDLPVLCLHKSNCTSMQPSLHLNREDRHSRDEWGHTHSLKALARKCKSNLVNIPLTRTQSHGHNKLQRNLGNVVRCGPRR